MRDRLDFVVTEWARRTPAAAAVVRDGRATGYADLLDRAEVVATALRQNGIRSGDVVAIAADRSTELVAALLGCLRADATALVLDPAWPPWCAEDVLDRAAVRAVLDGGTRVKVLRSTSDGGSEAAFLVFPAAPRPHGVPVTHRELLAALVDAESSAPRSRQVAPLGSMGFTDEVWTALLNGGCVVFDPPPTPDRPSTTDLDARERTGTGPRVGHASPGEEERAHEPTSLLTEVRGLLGDAALTPDDDLLDAGLTSLGAVRLATVLSVRGLRKVTVGDVYRERRLSAFTDAAFTDAAPAAPEPVDPVVPDTGHRPLAHAQKRFLFAEAYAPGSADNIVVEAYELTGPLRTDVLRAALGDVVAHHEALCTVYVWERGQPVQRVLTDRAVPWTDVRTPDGVGSVREVAERVTADLWDTPFRLDRDLPIRARLCRIGPDHALLCLQFHHIAFDGSSEPPLLDDLRHAYVARAAGDVPRFPPAPGYPLLGRLEARGLPAWAADDLPFWREALADCPLSCLPAAERGGDAEATAHEAVRRLDAATVRRLEAAAARRAGPPLAALSAGAAMALARGFDVDDVCVGTLTSGRFDPAVDRLVGYLVNPFAVPLRDVRREPGAVLAAAARQVVDGLEHARTPFDALVRDLRGAHPWFEAWVVLQHPPPAVSLGPVALRPVRVRPPRTARGWMVEAFPLADGGWDLVTTWRADVLSPETGVALADDVVLALTELADR